MKQLIIMSIIFITAFCTAINAETWKKSNIKITIEITNENCIRTVVSATLADNSSAKSLYEKIKIKPLTIRMHDFSNFEKSGELGFSLPQNNEQISTNYGDLILYLGIHFVIYYDTNNWNFTRLGKIDNITQTELRKALGDGDTTILIKKR